VIVCACIGELIHIAERASQLATAAAAANDHQRSYATSISSNDPATQIGHERSASRSPNDVTAGNYNQTVTAPISVTPVYAHQQQFIGAQPAHLNKLQQQQPSIRPPVVANGIRVPFATHQHHQHQPLQNYQQQQVCSACVGVSQCGPRTHFAQVNEQMRQHVNVPTVPPPLSTGVSLQPLRSPGEIDTMTPNSATKFEFFQVCLRNCFNNFIVFKLIRNRTDVAHIKCYNMVILQNVQNAAASTTNVQLAQPVALPSTPNVTILDGGSGAHTAAVHDAGITFGASIENGAISTPSVRPLSTVGAATDLTCDSSMPEFGSSPVATASVLQTRSTHKAFDSMPTRVAASGDTVTPGR
jgi:hypothetical protein